MRVYGKPVFGMDFMFGPTDGKLVYSRGRIVLIVTHLNSGGHNGDTIVIFNDLLTFKRFL